MILQSAIVSRAQLRDQSAEFPSQCLQSVNFRSTWARCAFARASTLSQHRSFWSERPINAPICSRKQTKGGKRRD